MHVNCDIGERGADHPVDRELMNHIALANIACGGHAGDRESVDAFLALAREKGIAVSAHLSYPDRENFGRTSMDISRKELLTSLDEQYKLMGAVEAVKFHGALYNDCWVDGKLASDLADWLKAKGIQTIITPDQSSLAVESAKRGITVMAEAFAERRYAYNPANQQLSLVSRKLDYASIHDLEEAVAHAQRIVEEGRVDGHIDDGKGHVEIRPLPLKADTICIHSDSPISLELAARLSASGDK
ncbi:MAG: LamB/YcsF family protein [Spirochaetales bacterium]|nr:LamB/YcsF family protein [Spirochaetales bacterium]